MEESDRGRQHPQGGVTQRREPAPERESLVTVLLKPDGAGTLLTLQHEQFFGQAAADGHRNGLDRFA
jgi:hypothetical protein